MFEGETSEWLSQVSGSQTGQELSGLSLPECLTEGG